MEVSSLDSVEESYEYDSSEVLDYSALTSFTDSNYADDEQEDGEPYTLEEGTVLFPLEIMIMVQAGTLFKLLSWIYISYLYCLHFWFLIMYTGAGLSSCESRYD